MLQDLDLLDEEEGVRGGNVICAPALQAGFGRRRRLANSVGANSAAPKSRLPWPSVSADVEGDEQVLSGIERVIHRWESH